MIVQQAASGVTFRYLPVIRHSRLLIGKTHTHSRLPMSLLVFIRIVWCATWTSVGISFARICNVGLKGRAFQSAKGKKPKNRNRVRVNQPPTGEGKKQSPRSGEANKLHKRAEVLQAGRAEQNVGTAEEEDAFKSQQQSRNPKRPKAGR